MKGLNKRSNKGFTLIELMAAVAIIGVLVMLAMPRYKAFVAKSRQGEAKANLGTIGIMQEAYQMSTYGAEKSGVSEGDFCCTPAAGLYGGKSSQCGASAAGAKNELGFRLTDCGKARYHYAIQKTGADTANGGKGTDSTYPDIYPDCGSAGTDEWSISKNERVLTHEEDTIADCED